jgi:hypothetical protein
MNMDDALREAGRKAQTHERAAKAYWHAKADFDRLDALSRETALTDSQSRQLESAINRMAEWGAVL